MKSLELKIPPALLMLIFAVGMWLLDRLLPMFKQTRDWRERVVRAVFLLAISCVISFRLAPNGSIIWLLLPE